MCVVSLRHRQPLHRQSVPIGNENEGIIFSFSFSLSLSLSVSQSLRLFLSNNYCLFYEDIPVGENEENFHYFDNG